MGSYPSPERGLRVDSICLLTYRQYLTTALAHAAVYLIRLTYSPKSVQSASRVEVAVLDHYIQMALDVLQSADVSEIGLGRYLVKRVQATRRRIAEERPQTANITSLTTGVDDATRANEALASLEQGQWGDPLNFEAFFQEQGEFDINCLLDPPLRTGTEDFFNNTNWGDVFGAPATSQGLEDGSLFE
jgi:hypothetical protein